MTDCIRMRAKYVTIVRASARGVAERWHEQYGRGGEWRNTVSGSSKDTYDRLVALGENPSIADAAKVIGNKSWTYISCNGCNDDVERAVQIGEYEGKTFCQVCVREAAAALELEP